MNTKTPFALATIFGGALLGATSSVCVSSEINETATERVMAHSSHYIVGGVAFDDLDALEAAVRAMKPKSLHMNACGGNAAQALQAATVRFRDLPLHLQVFDVSSPICNIAVARRASQSSALIPTGIDESAVKRYWSEVTP